MSGPIYGNGRRDKSEPEVVEEFERGGATVTKLSGKGIPDLLVGFAGRNYLVEVKTGTAKLRGTQILFGGTWRGDAPVVARNRAQAAKWLRTWQDRAQSLSTFLAGANAATGGGVDAAMEEQIDLNRKGNA